MTKEELLKVAKPILFNTAMVKAILDGRKTCTRRTLAEKAILDEHWGLDREPYYQNEKWYYDKQIAVDDYRTYELKSKYQVGDILYVRETWQDLSNNEGEYVYLADGDEGLEGKDWGVITTESIKWRPSIHMPKEAARIFLQVTDVRIERLQDITEEQARKEGCITYNDKVENKKFKNVLEFDLTTKDAFVDLWGSTIKKQDLDIYGWKANPWVWAIEFELIKRVRG